MSIVHKGSSMRVRVHVATVFLAALFVPSAGHSADDPTLEAFVGANDAFSIRLQDATRIRVTHVDAGTYTINVHDLSTIHSFHVTGPGVDMATPIDATAEATWTVTLTDGTYRYRCDAHAGVMKGSFTVGAVTASAVPTKLTGAIGPGRKISLRYAGGGKRSCPGRAASRSRSTTARARTTST